VRLGLAGRRRVVEEFHSGVSAQTIARLVDPVTALMEQPTAP